MAATFPAAPLQNQLAADLDELLKRSEGRIEWLVIAHHDPTMIVHLSQVLQEHCAALLPVAQHQWDFGASAVTDLLQRAMTEGKVGRLVLAGHSAGTESAAPLRFFGSPGETQGPKNEMNSLLGRVRATNQRIDRAKYDFSDHVILLNSTLESCRSQSDTQPQVPVIGLFYIAESGAFMAYDVAENKFHSLEESAA